MITVVNIKNKPWSEMELWREAPNNFVYVGRANKWLGLAESKWGNPFVLHGEKHREACLESYKAYILGSPDLLASLHELDDKILGCYCVPRRCHANILVELREKQLEVIKQRDIIYKNYGYGPTNEAERLELEWLEEDIKKYGV